MKSIFGLKLILCSIFYLESEVKCQIAFPDEELDVCTTPDRRDGICEPLVRCDQLLSAQNVKLLKQSTCGYDNDMPKVCCPLDEPPVQRPSTRRPTSRATKRPTTRRPVTRPTTRSTTTPLPNDEPEEPSRGRTVADKLPEICGNRSDVGGTRIVGGRVAKPGAWPWMAAILIEDSGQFSAQCGGALISEKHIITASHCVVENGQTLSPKRFKVWLGEHNIVKKAKEDAQVEYGVRKVLPHPKFEQKSYKNDIAILELSRKVKFNKRIFPICLPFDTPQLTSEEKNVGRSGHILGWGRQAFNGQASDELREADVEIVSTEECAKAFEKFVKISEQYLCAGSLGSTRDSCQGDSGGPLVQVDNERFYLTGVVSFGRRCATPGFPGVYARVSYFLDWITANL